MRRLLYRLAVAGGCLVALALVAYLTFGHPNDRRVRIDEGEATPLRVFYRREAALLQSGMPHQLGMDAAAFAAAKSQAAAWLPRHTLMASRRFVSPYQIYVPVGAYPVRLEARDALLIPAGQTLTVELRRGRGLGGLESHVESDLAGDLQLRYAVYGDGSALRLHTLGGDQLRRTAVPRRTDGAEAVAADWYRRLGRYLQADWMDRLDTWQVEKVDVTLQPGQSLAFTCEPGSSGCVLSDVDFLRPVSSPPRNAVVIVVDTLRADALDGGHAPAMRALADKSVRFKRALAPGNMTSPSTNALLACRSPSQLGQVAFAYGLSPETREDYYGQRQLSFPAIFAEHGHKTTMIGNISVISEIYGVGIHHGFETQVSAETDGYDTPQIAREAQRWLRQQGDQQFLLYLHFNGPHAPYRAPLADIWATYPGKEAFGSYGTLLRWLYQGEVRYTDRYLARVLSTLKELGLDEQTTVVLTADHGDQHTPHVFRANEAGPDFVGSFFDHGATMLDDEINVPLLIKTPQGTPREVGSYVSTLAVGPTLLAGAGLPPPAPYGCDAEGLQSFLQPALPAGGVPPPALIGSEGFQARAIVIDGRYKYIRSYGPTDKRVYGVTDYTGKRRPYFVAEQLYDLEQDQAEERNLAPHEAALLARARGAYRQHFRIGTIYELVIDAPGGEAVAAGFAPGTVVAIREGGGEVKVTDGGAVTFHGAGHHRIVLALSSWNLGAPTLTIGGEPVAVAKTGLRLPLTTPFADLPVEAGSSYSLPDLARNPAAFVRKVDDDGQQERQISSGNPEFEKVLREWGYLNDR